MSSDSTVVNCVNTVGETLLHLASQQDNSVEIIQCLLDNGSSLISTTNFGNEHFTPLELAIKFGCLPNVLLLLKQQQTITDLSDVKNEMSRRLLIVCAEYNNKNTDIIEALLVAGCDINGNQASLQWSDNWETPMHAALRTDNICAVQFLIKRGALLSLGGKNNQSILHAAVESKNIELVNLVLKASADIDLNARDWLYDGRYQNHTSLHYAVIYGCVDIVRLLVGKGANIECFDDIHNYRPLHLAAQYNNTTEIAEILLNKGCDVDGLANTRQNTPLHIALCENKVYMVDLLLKRGASLTKQGYYNQSVLHSAIESKNVELVNLIVASSPSLDIFKNNHMDSAAKTGSADIVKILLKKGVPTEWINSRGLLQIAVENCIDCETIELLLDAGCDVDDNIMKNHNGRCTTPLHIAVNMNKFDVVQILIDRGASLTAPDAGRDGFTPLHLAVKGGFPDIVKLLLANGVSPQIKDCNSKSPILCASDDPTDECTELLLIAGCEEKYIMGAYADTMLKDVIEWNKLSHFKFMVDRILSRQKENDGGCQSLLIKMLFHAIDSAYLRHVEYLLSIYAEDKSLFDMTQTDENGETPYKCLMHQASSAEFDEIAALFVKLGANVLSGGQFIPYSELLFRSSFKTRLFTPEMCQFGVICRGCYFLWFLLVQEDGNHINKLVSDITTAHPELATVKDITGRSAVDTATQSNKLAINSLLLWHGKYRVTESKPEHTSATCFVFKAVDESRTDESGNYIPVALKLMKVKNQFEREVNCRAENFDSTFVIDLVTHYVPSDGTVMFENGNVEMPVIVGALTKTQAESMYCVVMPLADRNMFVALKQERFTAQPELTEVRHIFTQLVRCVDHMHSKDMLHGDLKTLNIVRTGIQWKLIDLDASCRIGVDAVGAKSSSAYVSPESIHIDKVKCVAFVKSVTTSAENNFAPLIAHSSFDVWSLGCLLYQMCSNGKTLFQASTDDNLSGEAEDMQKEDSLWGLAEWSPDLKARKLSEVRHPLAVNLLSLLLEKDPFKRPSLSRILSHPFLTGKKGTRLVGEVPAFDVFISYRVASDAHHAEILYDMLTARGLKVWWDKKCLLMGVDWEQGFCSGLLGSGSFVCIISEGATNHPTIPWQNFSKLTADSRCDNVLLEHILALELASIGLVEKIFPVFIGEVDVTSGQYDKYRFPPVAPDVSVRSVEETLTKHMNNEGLGTPLHPNKTVSAVCTEIGKCNGAFIVGELTASFGAAADSIVSMIKGPEETIIPHSPGKMSARLRDFVKVDAASVLEEEVVRLEERNAILEQNSELLHAQNSLLLKENSILLKEIELLKSLVAK